MNLITRKELYGDLYWGLDGETWREVDGDLSWELYGELYWELCDELYEEVNWPLGFPIRTNFSHSKISRV